MPIRRAASKSTPYGALDRSITPVPSSNANTPRIHSTHSEQRIQYIIHQLRTPCHTAFKSTPQRARQVDHPRAFVQREYSEGSFNTFRIADSTRHSAVSHTFTALIFLHSCRSIARKIASAALCGQYLPGKPGSRHARTPCRTAFKSTPYGALVRSITPVPSSNANTPQIHSTHPEQRIQRAIQLFLTRLLR